MAYCLTSSGGFPWGVYAVNSGTVAGNTGAHAWVGPSSGGAFSPACNFGGGPCFFVVQANQNLVPPASCGGATDVLLSYGEYQGMITAGSVVTAVTQIEGYMVVLGLAFALLLGFAMGWRLMGRASGRSG